MSSQLYQRKDGIGKNAAITTVGIGQYLLIANHAIVLNRKQSGNAHQQGRTFTWSSGEISIGRKPIDQARTLRRPGSPSHGYPKQILLHQQIEKGASKDFSLSKPRSSTNFQNVHWRGFNGLPREACGGECPGRRKIHRWVSLHTTLMFLGLRPWAWPVQENISSVSSQGHL